MSVMKMLTDPVDETRDQLFARRRALVGVHHEITVEIIKVSVEAAELPHWRRGHLAIRQKALTDACNIIQAAYERLGEE